MSYIGSTPTTQSFIAGTDYFNGTGSQVAFTLSRSVNSVNDIEVIVNNVEQIPSGYSVSGTTLTFSAAPSSGTSNVYVRYLSTTNLSLAIPAGTSASFNTLAYTGTLTGGTGVVNLGSGQVYKDASGNVGLATSSPRVRLDVRSDAVIAAPTPLASAVASGVLAIGDSVGSVVGLQLNGSSYDTYIQSRNMGAGSTAYNLLLQPLGGNVGIGTGSPTAKLSVTSTSASDGIRITTADVQYIKFLNNSTKNWGFATTNLAASDFGIYRATSNGGDPISAGTPLLYFDGSGNMMVGKTNSSYDVNGQALLAGGQARFTVADGSPLLLLRNGSNGTLVEFWRGGIGPVGSISTNGSSTAYNTSSDYRLKEDIAPMTGALDKVALLKPITYKWKATGESTNGFIAHELQAVVPDCVAGEKDAVDADGNPVYQGIDVSFLVATLTAAIQEQQTLITALTARITALEAK